MKKTISKMMTALMALAMLALSLGGCKPEEPDTPNGGGSGGGEGTTTVAVTGVTLDKSTLSLVEGGSETLTATVAPSNATNKAVSWKTSDSGVATVDSNGKVTAVKAGSATITVTTTDGSKTANCSVTVTAKVVSVTEVTLDKGELELTAGETASLTSTVKPDDATDKAVEWSSSAEEVAKVDATGKVTAVSAGSATITVKTKDGGKTATCSVKVNPNEIPVESVTVDPETIEITEGDTYQLKAYVTPEDASQEIEWNSEDDQVAAVDESGLVTAVKPGEVTITVTTKDGGKTATCVVKVNPAVIPVESVTVDHETIEITEGDTYQLRASVTPEEANQEVEWISEDDQVAAVDETGLVTAVKPGEVKIFAKSKADGDKAAFCKVIVKELPLEKIEISPSSIEIMEGSTQQLEVLFTPAEYSDKSVRWAVDYTNIVSVSDEGLITALKPGTAKVYVESLADKTLRATCSVTVIADPALKGISFPYTSLTMKRGESKTFQLFFDPEYAENKNVKWESSDPSVVTVDSKGNVMAVWNGQADITATSEEGGFTATCAITVSQMEGAQVFVKTTEGIFLNGDKYTGVFDELEDVFSVGNDLYETYGSVGVVKNGSPLIDGLHAIGSLMGVASGRIYYFYYYFISIYDIESGQPLFGDALSLDMMYRNEAMTVSPGGTAYVVGSCWDPFNRTVGKLWTITTGLEVTEKTLYNGGNEETGVDVALDEDGNVWALTKGDGLGLYKNGEFVRVICEDIDGNRDHFLSFHGKDLYIVTTLYGQDEVLVYKNEDVLYDITVEGGIRACTRAFFSKDGDMYFGIESRSDSEKGYVFKNGKLLYNIPGGFIYRMAVIN